jgi:hypothetical protein
MRALLLSFLAFSGCATAKLAQAPSVVSADPGVARALVLEPFFEAADWKTTLKTEYAQVSNPYALGYGSTGNTGPTSVAITRQVQEKPLFARLAMLAEEHRRLLGAVQRLRPSWRVTSTSGASLLTGPVTVVRTVIEGSELTASDRTGKNLAFAFGLVLWPLEIYAGFPVEETQHVQGSLERYEADAKLVTGRLVRYPTQPDAAVNLAGLTPLRRPFGLDVSYTEGLLANELPRTAVLLDGFIDRLAAAVVALVEEQPADALPPPPPMPLP